MQQNNSTEINSPFHHQHSIINTYTSRQQNTENAQNTGNAYQQQRRKIASGGKQSMGFLGKMQT